MPVLRTFAVSVLLAVYAGGILVAQGPPSDPWAGYEPGSLSAGSSASPQPSVTAVANHQTFADRTAVQAARYAMNSRQFEIPVAIDRTGARPAEIRLYVSRDNGRTWQVSARSQPTQQPFGFSAPADGVYWFATRTFDASGRSFPPGNRFDPQLIVLVDTEKPNLSFQALAEYDGKVGLSYTVRDIALANNSLSISYMTDTDQTQWVTVEGQLAGASRDAAGALQNQIQFLPKDDWRYLNIKVQVSDQAGNIASSIQQIQRPRLAGTPAQFATSGYPNSQPPVSAASVVNQKRLPATGSPNPPNQTNNTPTDHGYSMQLGETHSLNSTENRRGVLAPNHVGSAHPQPGDINFSEATAGPPSSRPQQYSAGALPSTSLRGWGDQRPSQPWTESPRDPRNAAATPAMRAGYPSRNSVYDTNPSNPSPSSQNRLIAPNTQLDANSSPTNPGNEVRSPESKPLQNENHADRKPPVPPSSVMRPRTIESLPLPPGTPDQQFTTSTERRSTGEPNTDLNLLNAQGVAQTMRSEKPRVPSAVEIVETEVRHTKLNRFELSYEVDSLGARGVKAVELWGTRDGGQTWSLWGQDEDNESPFDIETRGSGLYGFSIVVVGHNGLTSPPPRNGDPAEIWIRVDQEIPETKITAARYGEGAEAGALIIEYQCQDGYLLDRAITLSFSESAEGPWTTIASGLENTGRYAWPADPRLPTQIYLRLEAVDHAGNIGVDSTSQPISVHGLAPRARIRGFQPIGRP